MKYLPLRDLENVTSALNFDTADCHIIGGCDAYTCKPAGRDKKLYKDVNNSLESQHDMLVRFSKSISPVQSEMFSLNLSRPSPFGPLNSTANRRKFAHFIAVLNATHPDYDFSNNLRPSDFRRERSLRAVMTTIDETLYNLRPRNSGSALINSSAWAMHGTQNYSQNAGGNAVWTPKMWKMIDNDLNLRQCEIYLYSPDDDPFDGEENSLWSFNYFFYNNHRRRVCYLYFRGLSISSHSPPPLSAPATPLRKPPHPISRQLSKSVGDLDASKRANYWFGEEVDGFFPSKGEKEKGSSSFSHPGDDEVDADNLLGPSYTSSGDFAEHINVDALLTPSDTSSPEFIPENDFVPDSVYGKSGTVRRMSEDIMESMEL